MIVADATDATWPPELVMATANPGKLAELRRMLRGVDVAVVAMADLGLESPVEDGATFEDNALIKARSACTGAHRISLADDSGLQVDALDGAPGVHSARFAGRHGDDTANNAKLLDLMRGVADRTARFVSAVAVVVPDGREWVVQATMEGRVLQAPDGDGGFGYDRLFQTDGRAVSNGRLAPEVKDRLSHRGRALREMLPVLAELFNPDGGSVTR